MKPSPLAVLLVAAAMLATGALAAACGGGSGGSSELTLEAYFQRLGANENDFWEASKGIGLDEPDDGFGSEQEEIEAFRDWYGDSLPILTDYVDNLEEIALPSEVEDPHQEFVGAMMDGLRIIADVAGRIENVASVSELDEALELYQPEGSAVRFRSREACTELQGIADQHGIDVDLLCFRYEDH